MNQPSPETIESLVLVRLLALPQKNRPGPAKIRDDLYGFVQDTLSSADWKESFNAAFEKALTDQLIVKSPLALTDAGRERALRFLGVRSLPANIRWPQLRDVFLIAKAIGLPPESAEVRQAVKQPERLRGLVVKQEHDLPTGELPTLAQAADALAWRKLGVETDEPFTQKNVLRFLLGQDLKQRTRLSSPQLRSQLPAQSLGLARGDPRTIRWALLRKWAAAELPSVPPQPQTLDLEDFARHVQDAARSLENGRFGDHKVFINHVWKKMKDGPLCQALDVQQFKQQLADANSRGLLSLTRADLVGAMNSQDVQESETKYLDSVFHFVQI